MMFIFIQVEYFAATQGKVFLSTTFLGAGNPSQRESERSAVDS